MTERVAPPDAGFQRMPLETRVVDLLEVIRVASSTALPISITFSAYICVRTFLLLIAVFGPKKEWADRALAVLTVTDRNRFSK